MLQLAATHVKPATCVKKAIATWGSTISRGMVHFAEELHERLSEASIDLLLPSGSYTSEGPAQTRGSILAS